MIFELHPSHHANEQLRKHAHRIKKTTTIIISRRKRTRGKNACKYCVSLRVSCIPELTIHPTTAPVSVRVLQISPLFRLHQTNRIGKIFETLKVFVIFLTQWLPGDIELCKRYAKAKTKQLLSSAQRHLLDTTFQGDPTPRKNVSTILRSDSRRLFAHSSSAFHTRFCGVFFGILARTTFSAH